MGFLERVLDENSGKLLDALRGEAGFTMAQAEAFLREAGPALIESYQWQAADLQAAHLGSPAAVRDLLAGISGRTLASRVGLSSARTWDGLRVLVPAAVCASADTTVDETIDAGLAPADDGCSCPGGAPTGSLRSRDDEAAHFEIGFGLTLDRGRAAEADGEAAGRSGISVAHPIFGHLLSLRDSPAS